MAKDLNYSSVLDRIRPSDTQKSYSFPSGHTTFSVFVLGALLYVILPLCVAGVYLVPARYQSIRCQYQLICQDANWPL